MSDVIKEKIGQEKLENDIDLQLLILGDYLTDEEKVYLFKNYKDRILKMDRDKLLFVLKAISIDLCEKIDFFLSEFLPTIPINQLESLLYLNKYEKKISDIIYYLFKQPWFLDKKYDIIRCAVMLEENIKDYSMNKEQLIDKGNLILDTLSNSDCDFTFFDMTLKNYLTLLQSKDPEYLEAFTQKGYSKIFARISDYQEITNNELIFICRDACRNMNIDLIEYCEIRDRVERYLATIGSTVVTICEPVKRRTINSYDDKRIPDLLLIYVIGHELTHHISRWYSSYYESKRNGMPVEKLAFYNSNLGDSLVDVDNSYYYKYHNSYSHEYIATICGLKYLYYILTKYSFFDKNLLEQVTRRISYELFHSYQYDQNNNSYISPSEFTRERFEAHKPLPKFARRALYHGQSEMPRKLEQIKDELTEEERFMLGYPNKYIELLKEIAEGKIKCADLFRDLPLLYDLYMSEKKRNY